MLPSWFARQASNSTVSPKRYQVDGSQERLGNLPLAALRAVFREGYGANDLRKDVFAGIVVGVIALPLSMALSIAVGVAPQHGLFTAIIAGFLVALLGGSRVQVTGPTAAFVVILAPVFTVWYACGLLCKWGMAGIILVVMGLFRLGKLIQLIPHPVTTGFTAGIATVLAVFQMKDFFGLSPAESESHFLAKVLAMFRAVDTVSFNEAAIGVGTLMLLLVLPNVSKRVPAPLIALPAVAVLCVVLPLLFPSFHVETIATRFSTVIDGITVQGIPRLPPQFVLPWTGVGANDSLTFATIRSLMPAAFSIAMLGAIESLLSAVVADGMAHTNHDPDSELLALGVGNIVVPFFAGIPATGAIARTATNVKEGARSPIASMIHAIVVLVTVLLMAPWLGYLPMASLAALLLLVARNMFEMRHVMHLLRVAPRGDVLVFLTCFGFTVFVDMAIGVSVGVFLAGLLFMRRMIEVTNTSVAVSTHLKFSERVPEGTVIYEISGPLFFGAAQKAMHALRSISDRPQVIIIVMEQVHFMDTTGLVAFESTLEGLRSAGVHAILSGTRSQPLELLRRAAMPLSFDTETCATTSDAIRSATDRINSEAKREQV
ncbi:MAG: C4-dicarboxylic acid transporter DauA [Myxococcota bacterium]